MGDVFSMTDTIGHTLAVRSGWRGKIKASGIPEGKVSGAGVK